MIPIPNPPEISIVELIVNSNTAKLTYHEYLKINYDKRLLGFKQIKIDNTTMKTVSDNTQQYKLKGEDIAEILYHLWAVIFCRTPWIDNRENDLNPHKNSTFSISVRCRDGKRTKHSGPYDRSGIRIVVKSPCGEDWPTFISYVKMQISPPDKSFMFDMDSFYNALRPGEYKCCVVKPDNLNESEHRWCRLDDLNKNVGDTVSLTDWDGKRFSGTIELIGFFNEESRLNEWRFAMLLLKWRFEMLLLKVDKILNYFGRSKKG